MSNSALFSLPQWVAPRPGIPERHLIEEAQDPNTAPARLVELSEKHPICQKIIAQNPNTPIGTLLHLWAKFPEAMLENPATDLLLLENPEAFARAASYILKAIFSLPNTPVSFYYMAWDSTPHYRDLMAGSASLPPDLVLLLSKSENVNCRSALAVNQALAKIPEVFAILEDDLFPIVRRGVAKNPALPFIYFEKLSTDWDSEVRENIGANPNTPLHLLEKLSHDKIKEVRLAVKANPSTPSNIKARLAPEAPPEKKVILWPKAITIGDSGKLWRLPQQSSATFSAMVLLPKPKNSP
jgi:hypothetical protein